MSVQLILPGISLLTLLYPVFRVVVARRKAREAVRWAEAKRKEEIAAAAWRARFFQMLEEFPHDFQAVTKLSAPYLDVDSVKVSLDKASEDYANARNYVRRDEMLYAGYALSSAKWFLRQAKEIAETLRVKKESEAQLAT